MEHHTPGEYRFTPTCVGNMHVLIVACAAIPASPPRAWGPLVNTANDTPLTRFTPTCVGNMADWMADSSPVFGSPPRAWGTCAAILAGRLHRAVHPHVRGEHGRS